MATRICRACLLIGVAFAVDPDRGRLTLLLGRYQSVFFCVLHRAKPAQGVHSSNGVSDGGDPHRGDHLD